MRIDLEHIIGDVEVKVEGNDWAVSQRCKRRGMSWVKQGVMALALRKAARHNGELDDWQKTRTLPDWRVP